MTLKLVEGRKMYRDREGITGDAVCARVRVTVQGVDERGFPIRGNRTRSVMFADAKVSDVVSRVRARLTGEEALES